MADLPQLFVHREVARRLLGLQGRPWEVGGWLLGWWADDRSSLFLTHATPPASRGTPFGVTISGRGHRPLFDQAWDESGGHVTFLGDWHTHPGGPAQPSKRDRLAGAALAEDPDFGTPEPLLAIVAAPRWPWSKRETLIAFFVRRDGELEVVAAHLTDTLPEVARRVDDRHWWHEADLATPVEAT